MSYVGFMVRTYILVVYILDPLGWFHPRRLSSVNVNNLRLFSGSDVIYTIL